MRRLGSMLALLGLTCLAAVMLSGVATASPLAPTSLPPNCVAVGGELPNLCPSTPTDVSDGRLAPQLQVRSDGTVRYHFDAVLWNHGPAFQLEGSSCSGSVCTSSFTKRPFPTKDRA